METHYQAFTAHVSANLEPKDFIVIGGDGSHASEIAERLRNLGFRNLFSVGDDQGLSQMKNKHFILAVGNPELRKKIFGLLESENTPISLLSNTSYISDSASIDIATYVGEFVVISHTVSVGKGCLVNWHVTIGHDVKIGDFSVLAPGARVSGWVDIGECVFIGAGAVILPGVRVGDGAQIGAGAVVTKDVIPGSVVKGNPAR